MSIQWFPGHMAKTRRLLSEQLKWVDVVIELGDARLPLSSRNPLLQELLRDKPRIIALNKADLADPKATRYWISALETACPVIEVSAAKGIGITEILKQTEKLALPKLAELQAKGIRLRPIRIMVVGIPNIGKSTLINQLAGGKARAKTGNKPGVTRGNQWIRVSERIELLDTPGLLWPKFDDPEIAKKLAASGAIKDEVFDIEELAHWLLEWLKQHYPESLKRYGDEGAELSLEDLGRKKGCLVKGGKVDLLKTSQILLREFRAGQLGQFTLDLPESGKLPAPSN